MLSPLTLDSLDLPSFCSCFYFCSLPLSSPARWSGPLFQSWVSGAQAAHGANTSLPRYEKKAERLNADNI